MLSLINVLFAFITLAILILVGRFVKQKIKLFQKLYLPESIIAGAIALLLGPGVVGSIAVALGYLRIVIWPGEYFPKLPAPSGPSPLESSSI
ncbi:hypothetical protein [Synechocystis sp. PCC 7339]|uniref:hypothetical protein n=1 Tax=Synechocystis sp. PCC 7339 TaxID=2782213 RepID=UPI0021023F28|nr:hypothetical protein [Synechocystis sp. PCC 7339]